MPPQAGARHPGIPAGPRLGLWRHVTPPPSLCGGSGTHPRTRATSQPPGYPPMAHCQVVSRSRDLRRPRHLEADSNTQLRHDLQTPPAPAKGRRQRYQRSRHHFCLNRRACLRGDEAQSPQAADTGPIHEILGFGGHRPARLLVRKQPQEVCKWPSSRL